MTHLEGHDIRGSSSKDSKASQVQTSIQQALERAKDHEHKRRRIQPIINRDQFEQLYIRWVIRYSIPFRMIECVKFRALFQFLDDNVNDWLPQSRTIVKEWDENL